MAQTYSSEDTDALRREKDKDRFDKNGEQFEAVVHHDDAPKQFPPFVAWKGVRHAD